MTWATSICHAPVPSLNPTRFQDTRVNGCVTTAQLFQLIDILALRGRPKGRPDVLLCPDSSQSNTVAPAYGPVRASVGSFQGSQLRVEHGQIRYETPHFVELVGADGLRPHPYLDFDERGRVVPTRERICRVGRVPLSNSEQLPSTQPSPAEGAGVNARAADRLGRRLLSIRHSRQRRLSTWIPHVTGPGGVTDCFRCHSDAPCRGWIPAPAYARAGCSRE